ncbi:Protein kinase domain-containing protein [Mycena venus]|uniref:Protein kinase domain-containing protein n=1 Tax=Mycena venus TaxID=2733690 RepID=A0A8H6X3D2_9AGAR|nr:Protein kinase domain-containing protein [Mycena venus]
MAWFIVTEVVRKEHFATFGDIGGLHNFIESWGISIRIADDVDSDRCQICRVSHFLGIWLETMLKVYTLEDLRRIPWHPECRCMERQLATIVHAGRDWATRVHPGRDSSVLSVLFDFIVSPWPLILWVVFRTVVHDPRDPPLETFLAILRGPEQELFVWDHIDDAILYQALVKNSEPGLFPQDWRRHMAEVDFQTWLVIRNITQTVDRTRRQPENLWIRLAAASLIFSSTLSVLQNILAPLDLRPDQSPFTSIAHVFDRNYTPQSTLANLKSQNFWVAANLRNWLSTRTQDHCHAIWLAPIPMRIVERVQSMHLILDPAVLPKNLAVYTYYLLLQYPSQHPDVPSNEFASLGAGQFLDTLQRYRLDVETLFMLLKSCKWSTEIDSTASHRISTEIYKHMKRDISVAVAELVVMLQDTKSYKKLLTYRGAGAQNILDFLQDFLDLDAFSIVKPSICKALLRLCRVSGLYPQCFALSGLEKVGEQVAAGGFGDIWKGVIRGRSVCVKIMRLFQNADIQALLKEFGREALIWRQLCHPNLLPFFGVYYLDNRLCLVSPWMEHGNVMQFLGKAPPGTNRLSLILDVALGLKYLHAQNVVHGDLKAINILVTPSRRACIADFGLASIANAMTLRFTHSTANVKGGTARYQAPELLQGESPSHFGSDVYAFACVCYEVGMVPSSFSL